ncbi:cation channel sperm-associated protein 2-like [Erpetoichthys calabaricus]|uniref:cation channel sperm-associated protein 2-like n=1 Tax=Erpetoichthys calabaricus TaxID=27687 RepID=UPI00223441CA|nr:cation channel sperm-associated protein 2-like [Erpetoichthys calabaricus]
MLEECLETDEHELVGYDIPPMRNPYITKQDRRQMRVQNRFSRFPPLNMWANWLLNKIVDKVDDTSNILVVSLDVLDCIITYVFISEIVLRWIDDFFEFWKSLWNVFDFIITFLSVLPELLDDGSAATINLQFVKVIKILHVLRSLKMVSKVRQVRLIAMSFILLFLTIFFYIFTITGVLLFSDYKLDFAKCNIVLFVKAALCSLKVWSFFLIFFLFFYWFCRDIPNTLVTLFILFTLDHWYAMAREILKVVELDHASCIIFIILWIFIGAFIFRNIFVGIMVNNFQAIRNELMKDFQQIEEQLKADQFKVEALNRYDRESEMYVGDLDSLESKESEEDSGDRDRIIADEKVFARRDSIISLSKRSTNTSPLNDYVFICYTGWDLYVRKNLRLLRKEQNDERVTWPVNSLIRYFELLENLHINLQTRKQLQFLAGGFDPEEIFYKLNKMCFKAK